MMDHRDEQPAAEAAAVRSHKRPNYFAVFLALGALTLAEVGVTFLPFNYVPILAALAAAKIVLVAMFYMHLKTDSRWYTILFLTPIPFVVLIVMALLVGGV